MKNKLYFFFSIFTLSLFILSGCESTTGSDKNEKTNTETKVSSDQKASSNDTKQQSDNLKVTKSIGDKQLFAATIIKNIDGDTVEINLNGKEEKVRMLCVDTPETHHPRLGVQPFGPEASDFTKKTLYVGREVQIETGIGNGRDKYGRLLAYIYVDGKMFNEMLLERGLARVAYIYAPNTKYVDEFYRLQNKAQQKEIGIWSIENYAKDDGFHVNTNIGTQETTSSNTTSSSSNNATNNFQNKPGDDRESNVSCKGKIKGNANSNVYHVPGGSYYDSTQDNIVWFCTEKEAENAGFRKSKR